MTVHLCKNVCVRVCVYFVLPQFRVFIRENFVGSSCRWVCIFWLPFFSSLPSQGPSFCVSESFLLSPADQAFANWSVGTWFKRRTSPASIWLCRFSTHHSLTSSFLWSEMRFFLSQILWMARVRCSAPCPLRGAVETGYLSWRHNRNRHIGWHNKAGGKEIYENKENKRGCLDLNWNEALTVSCPVVFCIILKFVYC